MIKFSCENCGHQLQISEHYAGKKGRCPKCKHNVYIPPAAQNFAQDVSKVKFRCPNCNQKIGLPANYSGKHVRCAKCKLPYQVPQLNSKTSNDDSKSDLPMLLQEPNAASLKDKISDDSPSKDSDYIQLLAQVGNLPTTITLTESKGGNHKFYWYDTQLGEILFKILLYGMVIPLFGLLFLRRQYDISFAYIIIYMILIGIIHNFIFFSWVLTQPKKERNEILIYLAVIFFIFFLILVQFGLIAGLSIYGFASFSLLPVLNAWYIFGIELKGAGP